MKAHPAPVVSGRKYSGDLPFTCFHVIPLSDGETVVKRGAELSCSGRAEVLGPNSGAVVENILLPAIQARPNVLRR